MVTWTGMLMECGHASEMVCEVIMWAGRLSGGESLRRALLLTGGNA
jgi:hypothetical protein